MKYLELLEKRLTEVNMSPNTLRKLAAGIDALAGMEFEMIVPNVEAGDDDDDEIEADYSQDVRARNFRQIREFFHDGDFNGRREVERLENTLIDDYISSDWLSEKKQELWEEDSFTYIKEYVESNYYREYYDQAVEEMRESSSEFDMNSEVFRNAVNERADELVSEKIKEIRSDMGREYDDIYSEWESNEWTDKVFDDDLIEEWLESEGLDTMSDIQGRYDISWPFYTRVNKSGDTSIDVVADDFSNSVGRPVNWSSRYHSAKRAEGHYVVEPDSSIEADSPGDSGLEFVSPPLPISELLNDLKKVKKWAGDYGCYTNDSTGLHINVSVPGFSAEKLDYVKLALLLGDEYVLEQFGRAGNIYAKSALGIVKQHIKQRPEDAQALLQRMKEHLNTAAARVIHSGITKKYTSINNKTGYIEFRSPGGDWLDENFDKIENTLLRFVVALDAAIDETKYKQDYAKKLYKLLAPSGSEPDILELFANYSAGELPKDALIRQVRQKQLARDIAKGKAPAGQKYWWNVQWDANRRIEVVANSAEMAKQVAAKEWGVFDTQLAGAKVTPLRPYKESENTKTRQQQGTGQDSSDDQRSTATGNFTGYWLIQDPNGVVLHRFGGVGNNQGDANRIALQWLQRNPRHMQTGVEVVPEMM